MEAADANCNASSYLYKLWSFDVPPQSSALWKIINDDLPLNAKESKIYPPCFSSVFFVKKHPSMPFCTVLLQDQFGIWQFTRGTCSTDSRFVYRSVASSAWTTGCSPSCYRSSVVYVSFGHLLLS